MNPFSLPITDPELYLMREKQRIEERASTAEQRLVPVHMRQNKRTSQILEELRRPNSPLEQSFKKNQRSRSFNRENIQELILRKREILLTKKKIEHKKNSISFLDTIAHSREEEHKKAAKCLEDNLLRVEKYEENLKTEAKRRADMAEKKTKERIEKQIEINELQQEIDHLHGMYDRNTEELRQLLVLKAFVEELSSSPDPDKTTTFMTENFETLYSSNNLLQSIMSLEKINLFLIQQAQEGEINLENLKSKNNTEIKQLENDIEQVSTNIKTIERNKEILSTKLAGMLDEHVEKPLISVEVMKAIHDSLVDIFLTIGGDMGTYPSDFEMLEALENSIRAEINKSRLLGEEGLRLKEKEVDKLRRVRNVENLKLKEIEKAKEISETLERRKKKVIKKTGRIGMERSKIPEKVKEKVKVEIPQEILDRREFLEEYIPYP